MRAARVGNPAKIESLSIVDAPDPGQPGPDEILVRLRANSVNFKDYLVVTGVLPVAGGRIPMSDAGGEVVAVGEGVTDLAVGDQVVSTYHTRWPAGRVMPVDAPKGVPGDGVDGYARELAVTPATWFTRAPKGYSHAEAATLTCAGLAAWRGLMIDGPVVAGQTVLVLGTGGVSMFALQFAKAAGANIVATSSSDEKLERLKAMGARHVINYKSTPEWGQAVYDLTGGVDHMVDIGGPGTLPQSIAAMKLGGHIALIGVLTGRAGEVPTAMITRKLIRVQGVQCGSREDHLAMVDALDATSIRPVIDSTYTLENLRDAFEYQKTGNHFGKVVIEI